LLGSATTSADYNNIYLNRIFTNGTATGGNTYNYGIYLLTNTNFNNITNNTINTWGLGIGNVGIQIAGTGVSSDNNSICLNNIFASGTVSANHGIFLNSNTSLTNITGNTITTGGTTTNYGIYILGVVAAKTDFNTISSNFINSSGTTASNHGIYIAFLTHSNNITKNIIFTNGSATSYGIHLLGTGASSDNNTISSNIITTARGGSTASNHGIYVSNSSKNLINLNTILANGSTTNYGIYILGALGGSSDNNIIDSNNITALGAPAASSNIGIRVSTNANFNNITNNNITALGTTANYGIEVDGAVAVGNKCNNNSILSNKIWANGSIGASNFGIYLVTDANSNNVTGNTIFVQGTTTNYGVYVYGTTAEVTYNSILSNSITVYGTTASNHGVYLSTNASFNTVSQNVIATNGSTTNYGIYILGATNAPSNYNTIDLNNITAAGALNVTGNIGIRVSTNTNFNNITNNNASVFGTVGNIGLQLDGTAVMTADSNTISSNQFWIRANTTNNWGIYLTLNTNSNNITNNIISTNGTATNYGIYLLGTTSPIRYNTISSNNITITANGTTNHGIYLLNNVNKNNIIDNLINVNGTTGNFGIILTASSENNIAENIIKTFGTTISNDAIYLSGDSTQNTIQNNIVRSAVGNGLQLLFSTNSPDGNIIKNNTFNRINGTYLVVASPDINGIQIINQQLGNYSFASLGSREVVFESTDYGKISFSQAILGIGNNLSQALQINNNSISIISNSTFNLGLNKSANLIFYGLPNFTAPIALVNGSNGPNGQLCPDNICKDLTILGNGRISINVTGWSLNLTGASSYSIAEASPQIINLIAPENWLNTTSQNITFQFNVTENNLNSSNCSLYLNSVRYGTNETTLNATLTIFDTFGLNASVYYWNITCINSYGSSNTSETRALNIVGSSTLALNYPANSSYFNGISSILLNYTAYDRDLSNMTLWLYGNGTLLNVSYNISNGTTLTYNWTGLNLGQRNWTVIANNGLSNSTINYSYFNIINLTINCQAGGPYQTGALVLIQGNVSDGISALSSQSVNTSLYKEGIFSTSKDLTSLSDGSFQTTFSSLADGNYTLNASFNYQGYNKSCSDNFTLGGGGVAATPASFILDKIASFLNITNETISYNITLRATNKGGSSATSANITDTDSTESPYDIETINASQTISRSYIKTYQRNSTTHYNASSIAQAQGIDSFSSSMISANSSSISLTIPSTETGQQLTLVKNAYFNSENSTAVNYTLSVEVVNSGGVDLTEISLLDLTDLNLNTLTSLNRTQSYNFSDSLIIYKAASNTEKTFSQATGTVNSVVYTSNEIKIGVAGYGGPADTIVYASAYVPVSTSFDSTIEIINMNVDIGQNFVVDYWITNNAETENYTSGQQTIYVPSSESRNITATLNAPSSAGIYKFKARVNYVNGQDTSFGTFEATAETAAAASSASQQTIGGGTTSTNKGGRIGGLSIQNKTTEAGAAEAEEIVCNSPYMRYGKECCLDINKNNICDMDEKEVEITKILVIMFLTSLVIFLSNYSLKRYKLKIEDEKIRTFLETMEFKKAIESEIQANNNENIKTTPYYSRLTTTDADNKTPTKENIPVQQRAIQENNKNKMAKTQDYSPLYSSPFNPRNESKEKQEKLSQEDKNKKNYEESKEDSSPQQDNSETNEHSDNSSDSNINKKSKRTQDASEGEENNNNE